MQKEQLVGMFRKMYKSNNRVFKNIHPVLYYNDEEFLNKDYKTVPLKENIFKGAKKKDHIEIVIHKGGGEEDKDIQYINDYISHLSLDTNINDIVIDVKNEVETGEIEVVVDDLSCKYLFKRGKNKGNLCGKKNCKVKSHNKI